MLVLVLFVLVVLTPTGTKTQLAGLEKQSLTNYESHSNSTSPYCTFLFERNLKFSMNNKTKKDYINT